MRHHGCWNVLEHANLGVNVACLMREIPRWFEIITATMNWRHCLKSTDSSPKESATKAGKILDSQ